jgi:hypothetical protein
MVAATESGKLRDRAARSLRKLIQLFQLLKLMCPRPLIECYTVTALHSVRIQSTHLYPVNARYNSLRSATAAGQATRTHHAHVTETSRGSALRLTGTNCQAARRVLCCSKNTLREGVAGSLWHVYRQQRSSPMLFCHTITVRESFETFFCDMCTHREQRSQLQLVWFTALQWTAT